MKYSLYIALMLTLALGAGCKKGEDGNTEMMSAEEVVETSQETAAKAVEKTAEVTQKAEEVTKQATAAVSSLTVKAEDVMADLNQSVEEIKQKAAAMNKEELYGSLKAYKDVILEKKDQVAALAEQVKNLSVMEMAGEKGRELKAQLDQYKNQLTALKERYVHYYNKLEEYMPKMDEFDLSGSAD